MGWSASANGGLVRAVGDLVLLPSAFARGGEVGESPSACLEAQVCAMMPRGSFIAPPFRREGDQPGASVGGTSLRAAEAGRDGAGPTALLEAGPGAGDGGTRGARTAARLLEERGGPLNRLAVSVLLEAGPGTSIACAGRCGLERATVWLAVQTASRLIFDVGGLAIAALATPDGTV